MVFFRSVGGGSKYYPVWQTSISSLEKFFAGFFHDSAWKKMNLNFDFHLTVIMVDENKESKVQGMW